MYCIHLIKTCFEQWSCAFFLRSLYKDVTQRDMSLHLTPSSDWDGWTPPDMDQISDIPTIETYRHQTVRQMIRASKGGVWLDSRATLHSLVSKMPWAKVPLVQSLRRRKQSLKMVDGDRMSSRLTFDPNPPAHARTPRRFYCACATSLR